MSDSKKRTTLTPAERVAKLERELAEAKAKAEVKSRKQADTLLEQRSKLVAQIQERSEKIEAIDAELRQLNVPTEAPADASSIEAPADENVEA